MCSSLSILMIFCVPLQRVSNLLSRVGRSNKYNWKIIQDQARSLGAHPSATSHRSSHYVRGSSSPKMPWGVCRALLDDLSKLDKSGGWSFDGIVVRSSDHLIGWYILRIPVKNYFTLLAMAWDTLRGICFC